MKIIPFFLILLLLTGCNKQEIERGLNLHQLQSRVGESEAQYLKEMEYIFSNYDLTLYDIQKIRSSTFYYLVEREGFFNMKDYMEDVKPKLEKKGWILVNKDEFGELYCNVTNQEIGITFPTNKKELDGVNSSYFTYQFYKKVSITLVYNSDNKSLSCNKLKKTPYV